MALEFGFYDSYNHDRMYDAQNMNDIFEGVIRDGVYAGVGNMFAVRPGTGLQVIVDTGRAWYKMTWNKNRTMAPLNLDRPDPVYDRIDTICIRVRKNILYRMNDFFIYKGNILVNAQPPVIQETSDTFYLPLANVRVRANAEEIKVSDIEILVGKERCPFVTSILQQTDISDLFAQWRGQFEEWWGGIKDLLDALTEGDIGAILSAISSKVDKADKATEEDISANSDNKWMTPKRTKDLIQQTIGEVGVPNDVVNSFNGRKGDVEPEKGDYTADDVGALPINGGRLTGNLMIGGNGTLDIHSLTVHGAATLGESNLGSATTILGPFVTHGSSTFNNPVRMKNSLRLQSDLNYGNVLNFGDGDYVHISEPSDNAMEVKANSINFVLNGSSGSNNTNFRVNGVNPFNTVPDTVANIYQQSFQVNIGKTVEFFNASYSGNKSTISGILTMLIASTSASEVITIPIRSSFSNSNPFTLYPFPNDKNVYITFTFAFNSASSTWSSSMSLTNSGSLGLDAHIVLLYSKNYSNYSIPLV